MAEMDNVDDLHIDPQDEGFLVVKIMKMTDPANQTPDDVTTRHAFTNFTDLASWVVALNT
jgi:hypothetical protein